MNEQDLVEASSGNAFADLGFEEPELELVKARLSAKIAAELAARRWTQRKAAAVLGIDQPRVSMLVRGKTGQFSLERLIDFLERLNFDVKIGDPLNATTRMQGLAVFRCPSDVAPDHWTVVAAGTTTPLLDVASASYAGVFGKDKLENCNGLPPGMPCKSDGAFFLNSRIRFADVKDGLTTTMFIGEHQTRIAANWFYTWVGVIAGGDNPIVRILGDTDVTPNHDSVHSGEFASYHSGGAQFTMGDGSVHFINSNIDLRVYRSLTSLDGHETVSDF